MPRINRFAIKRGKRAEDTTQKPRKFFAGLNCFSSSAIFNVPTLFLTLFLTHSLFLTLFLTHSLFVNI